MDEEDSSTADEMLERYSGGMFSYSSAQALLIFDVLNSHFVKLFLFNKAAVVTRVVNVKKWLEQHC